ncbi:MAG TPA: hypothetical protein VEI02_06070, partial [Planctomycetota bacterium]|nr:hypothetical protein [Planctomycetota bacterium]
VEARFDRVALRPYGGTLLHLVLDRIVGNFREDDPDAVARFDRLAAAERALLDAEAIPSDFAVGVYRRRDGRRRG